MTSDVPPVPVPTAAPPRRPDVPVMATLATIACGLAMLAAVCAGGAAFTVTRRARREMAEHATARSARAADRAKVERAKASLEAVAARIEATSRSAGELPEALTETPPDDPWGRPVEYFRLAPDHAVLRSAGPDGKPGTKDDVRRELTPR